MSKNMQREFGSRDELVAYLHEQFPEAAKRDAHTSQILGGRASAETALAKVDAAQYAKSRNFLTGAVTKLSPYIRYHMRVWLAAYIVHWRRVRWQTGAKWFLEHLLDGDPASNNMSWQWVASTFSQKPYYFNRENLERYTEGVYCCDCPLYGSCDFEGSYEELEQRLFPKGEFSNNRSGQSWQRGKGSLE